MKIHSVQVINYKCFYDLGEIIISPLFTIITGKNNAGKTALTQALSLNIENKPHRSFETVPTPTTPIKGQSSVRIKIDLSVQEFYELYSNIGEEFNFYRMPTQSADTQIQQINSVFEKGTLPLMLEYNPGGFTAAYLDIPCTSQNTNTGFQFSIPKEGKVPIIKRDHTSVVMNSTAPYLIAPYIRDRLYHFNAERFNVGQYGIGPDPNLHSDARNLAQVLNNLQTKNPSKFGELIAHANTIFPDVHYITAPPHEKAEGMVWINVWPVPVPTQRADLAIPLQESGTGLGQVLAILYVAISSEYPRPIIIDEPQSFLHPGAIRNLISILQTYYSQHQYIVTTHSPIVLTSAVSSAIIHLTKTTSESSVQIIDPSNASALKTLLSDVGARLSDVFGADKILWVEGRTEEECFPIILNKIVHRALVGTAIVGIINVGDIQGRDASKIISIYRRLCTGNALIPPSVGFIFDKEGKSTAQQDDIIRMSPKTVHFIPRRMYENYLIKPAAIAAVISDLPGFPKSPVPEEKILEWLQDNGDDKKFLAKEDQDIEVLSDEWLKAIDGAKLLQDLFIYLSDGTFGYEKVEYGIALTTFLCEHAPEALSEIAQFIELTLNAGE